MVWGKGDKGCGRFAIHIIADAVLVLGAMYSIWPALWTL